MILKDYDERLVEIFKMKSFFTISDLPDIVRIDFKNDDIEELFNEALTLVEKLFNIDVFYARISFWDKEYEEKYSSKCILIEEKKDCLVGIFKFRFFDIEFKELLMRHLCYEKGLDPYLNITSFFFNFDSKILLNIYDDRGADYLKK